MTLIDKTFAPADFEQRWYAHWETSGAFRPARPDALPFTIIIPPPNVTGSLHLGHALDNTLQDVLIRYHRLKGRDARWVVGTDHAGIATQMVVERQLAESTQGTTRQDMGREAFVQTVWDWKEVSGGAITRQLRRLGASCDWAHERFTMDEGFNKAVTRVFVQLYNEGLLYRDKRLVNWDPKFKTAISDLEVETREVQGTFTHIRYPLADGVRLASGADHIIVATTRPETMLGDTAVAVNASDERYRSVIGKHVRLPITGRLIPIVADDHADPELGSGAVKITPAHDFNDFEVGKRHGMVPINVLDADAHIIAAEGVPADYVGLDRFEARKKVVADLEALGLIEAIEAKTIQMPYGDRSGVVVEPWLTDQWYVNAGELAKPALAAVRDGKTQFVPKTWEKTYFNWMENIQPWCVSRQLWWGHQIPAWHGYGFEVTGPSSARFSGPVTFVAATQEEAVNAANSYYADLAKTCSVFRGSAVEVIAQQAREPTFCELDAEDDAFERGNQPIWRDPDVLDTWFSSALWPFATLGWPENTPDLARHYPGDVLVTGFDIIFFWVARMMMQGLHFMDEVPFHTVYCHGLVRDAKGAKMSKSKGNAVDPLVLVDKYGADALRFTLTAMESQGRDIKLDEKRVEGYRNFATKLWNAARFCQSNGIGGATAAGGIAASTSDAAPPASHAVNRWIIGEVAATARALDAAIAAFRFDAYAEGIYQFVWNRFCDWYLELTKPLLAEGADAAVAAETRLVTGWALDRILVMLHPVMPFLTEELWHKLGHPDGDDLIVAAWPDAEAIPTDTKARADIDWIIAVVSEFRSVRADLQIPYSTKLSPRLVGRADADEVRVEAHVDLLARMIGLSGLMIAGNPRLPVRLTDNPIITYGSEKELILTSSAAQVIVGSMTFVLPLEGVIDLAAERARLTKSAEAAEKEAASLAARLASPGFVEKAKPEAVEKARADHADRSAEAARLRAALARLG